MSLKDLIDGLLSLCIMRFTDFYCVTCGSIENFKANLTYMGEILNVQPASLSSEE